MTTAVSTPYLVADSAHVTVMRPLASSAFGTYNLQVPKDIELEDIHTFAAPGNELGYVASLVKGRRVGGWARRFVRCDVSVTAKDDRDSLRVSESNVDAVLREARDRTAGDFFLESSITQAGLGPWVPLVDFAVGDLVNVEIFGRVVQLPVTRIEPIVDDAVIVGWLVHVGGQVVGDAKAREDENAEIRRALVRDQRDLAGLEAQVSKAVRDSSDARSTADSAKQVADDARRAVASAESVIVRSLAASSASVAQGHVFAQEAYESYEKARDSYVSALSALDEMERLLGESDAVLRENAQLAEDIKQIHSQVSVLGAQVRVASQQMGALLGSVSGNVALSLQYSEEAREAVADAADLRRQVDALLLDAQDAITEGRKHVQSALSYSQAAGRAVSDAQAQARLAKQEADRAIQALDDAQGVKSGADAAAKLAGEKLADLQREADETLAAIDVKQNEVLALHQEVLVKHGQVIDAHDVAIRAVAEGVKAAGAAAGSASMGAMYAQLTAEDAARAADSALDAAAKNTEAIALLTEAQEKLEEASLKLAAANDENAKAIDTLREAQELQDQINLDLVAADEKLKDAQTKLEEQTANLNKAVGLTNQAVRAVGAAAGFAAQTGMHAADVGEKATRTAESALEANALHGQAILATQYSIEYNKTIAEAQFAKKLGFTIETVNKRLVRVTNVVDGADILIQSRISLQSWAGGQYLRVLIPSSAPAGDVSWVAVVSVRLPGSIAEQSRIFPVSLKNHAVATGGQMFATFVPASALDFAANQTVQIDIEGIAVAHTILPMYQKQLDALTDEYRKKGLPI